MNVPCPAWWSRRPDGRRPARPRRPTARPSSGRATARGSRSCRAPGARRGRRTCRSPVSSTRTFGRRRPGESRRGGQGRRRGGRPSGRRQRRRVGEAGRRRRALVTDDAEVAADAVGQVHLVRPGPARCRPAAAPSSPTSSDVFHRSGGTAPRSARSRAPMRPTRGGWSRPAAEEVQAIIALDPAGDLVVGLDVELQHDGVRAHEAHPPGRVGGDGDAPPGQLRFEGPERVRRSRRAR